MLKKNIKISHLALIISFINLILYHIPLYKFICNNIDFNSLNSIGLLISITILVLMVNALLFYITFVLLGFIGKYVLVVFFNINAVAVYFINTYNVLIDKAMIGNVLNTKYEESSSFLSFTLLIYLIFLGIIPSILLIKVKIVRVKFKQNLAHISLAFIFTLLLVYVNSANWLWIDKNSKTLGSLVMPWSYVVNTNRFFYHKNLENQQQILLPNAIIQNDKKSIAVLVIGESARSANFSLYGYKKNTNPLLSKIKNVHSYKAKSCATYTTAGVKCILEHKNSSNLFEILPNYLFRNGVEVIWRTTNWGEPKVLIEKYQKRKELKKLNIDNEIDSQYDEILLSGIKEQIVSSKNNKILVVLHTSTSHGPIYSKKYPQQFNKFTPICESVELAKCTQEELINAYDNTIVYTDYILASLIDELKQIDAYDTSMIYVSDHGESLGENNLYMHGIPSSIAPKEQLEIPFIVWLSNDNKKLKDNKLLSQQHVFHSVLDLLGVESPIYDEAMSIFKK